MKTYRFIPITFFSIFDKSYITRFYNEFVNQIKNQNGGKVDFLDLWNYRKMKIDETLYNNEEYLLLNIYFTDHIYNKNDIKIELIITKNNFTLEPINIKIKTKNIYKSTFENIDNLSYFYEKLYSAIHFLVSLYLIDFYYYLMYTNKDLIHMGQSYITLLDALYKNIVNPDLLISIIEKHKNSKYHDSTFHQSIIKYNLINKLEALINENYDLFKIFYIMGFSFTNTNTVGNLILFNSLAFQTHVELLALLDIYSIMYLTSLAYKNKDISFLKYITSEEPIILYFDKSISNNSISYNDLFKIVSQNNNLIVKLRYYNKHTNIIFKNFVKKINTTKIKISPNSTYESIYLKSNQYYNLESTTPYQLKDFFKTVLVNLEMCTGNMNSIENIKVKGGKLL